MCDYESFVEDYNNLNITTHDVRRIHSLNSREYCNVRKLAIENGDIPKTRHMNKTNAKFYSKRKDGTYDVQKQYKNKKLYVGRFPSEEIAKKVVEKCIQTDWVISGELEFFINENKCKPKNYSIVNGYYIIQKSINGKNKIFAVLKCDDWTENEIELIVSRFRKVKWNKILSEKILKEEKFLKEMGE